MRFLGNDEGALRTQILKTQFSNIFERENYKKIKFSLINLNINQAENFFYATI